MLAVGPVPVIVNPVITPVLTDVTSISASLVGLVPPGNTSPCIANLSPTTQPCVGANDVPELVILVILPAESTPVILIVISLAGL